MTVTIRLFARARDLAGHDTLTFDLPDSTTVAQMREKLAAYCEPLRPLLARCAFAVNEEFVDDEQIVQGGATVAVIPPVSGG